MNNLLLAHFTKLRKDRAFLVSVCFMLLFGAAAVVALYCRGLKTGYSIAFDKVFFIYPLVLGFVCAAFCSLYIGTEHSDGALRNKIVVGQSRSAIYLSTLLVCFAASTVQLLAYLLGICSFGIPLLGASKIPLPTMLALIGISLLTSFALCAVFTCMGLLNQNKAVVCVLSILGFVAFLFVAVLINARLNEPPVYDSYTYMDNLGNIVTDKAMPNPNYLEGTAREIYQSILEFLPTGQALLLTDLSFVRLWTMPLFSLVFILLTTLAGIFAFRKKDIK